MDERKTFFENSFRFLIFLLKTDHTKLERLISRLETAVF